MPHYDRQDHYYRKAKQSGLASRAFYKLEEMHKKFHLVSTGMRVLELGCAPGGWLQWLCTKVGQKGRVVGVDRLPLRITTPPQATVVCGDFLERGVQEEILNRLGGPANLVLSDLSPDLSGIRFRDQSLSFELAMTVWKVAQKVLQVGSHLVIKIFPGEDSKTLEKELRSSFEEWKVFVPDATRKGSSEVYWIGKKLRKI